MGDSNARINCKHLGESALVDISSGIFAGSVGFFWPLGNEGLSVESEPQRGYIQLNADGIISVETLDENPIETMKSYNDNIDSPSVVSGSTRAGGFLLFQVSDGGAATSMASFRASVRKYLARSALFGVSADEVKFSKFKNIEAFLPGIDKWAGVKVSDEKITTDDVSGRTSGFTLSVQNVPEVTVESSRGTRLTMSAHWSVEGPRDRREIYCPVTIGCASDSPADLWDLVYPLIRIQDLINIAYDGFVVADGGNGILFEQDPESSPKEFWNHWLMVVPRNADAPDSMTEFPFFYLDHIGGLGGLVRWLDLCDSHPRAVRPAVDRYRIGGASPELALLEVAAAMEYWTGAHARMREPWTRARYPSLALAQHGGQALSDWVGDSEKWADSFWTAYNKLKHDPAFQPDLAEIQLLANVGHRVLISELLAVVAGDESIRKRYLSHHRIHNYGAYVRRFLAST